MQANTLTDAELLLLGLVTEMPRHGYEIEQTIETRGMREWTSIGFSSIYFVLGKLEKAGLIAAAAPAGRKARKVFSATPAGYAALASQSLAALRDLRPGRAPVLLGLAHWPALDRAEALAALETRLNAVVAEADRLRIVRFKRRPLPDFVEAMFDYADGQLQAEKAWIEATLAYMSNKR
jgi:DNA-binding PadR family transcriptional regulator